MGGKQILKPIKSNQQAASVVKLDHKISLLSRDNERLKTQNDQLRKELETDAHHKNGFGTGWRRALISLFVVLAALCLVAGNLLLWAGNTLFDNQKYSTTVNQIIDDTAVQTGIADYTTNVLFESVDVTNIIANALPERAQFLAQPLTGQVKRTTNSTLKRVLAGPKFQQSFINISTIAHKQFITAIKNANSDGTINLSQVYSQLAQNLGSTKLAFLADHSLPPRIGSINLIDSKYLSKATFVANHINYLKPVALLFIAIFSAVAIWLAKNRRRVVISLGAAFSLAMLVSLVAFRLIGQIMVSHISQPYQTAVEHAYNIATRALIVQTTTILVIGVLLSLVAWLTGPSEVAAKGRERLRNLLTGKLHVAIFGKHETTITRWIGHYKRRLEWAYITLIAVIMLTVRLNPSIVFKYVAAAIVGVLIIEVLAAPHDFRRKG